MTNFIKVSFPIVSDKRCRGYDTASSYIEKRKVQRTYSKHITSFLLVFRGHHSSKPQGVNPPLWYTNWSSIYVQRANLNQNTQLQNTNMPVFFYGKCFGV